MMLLLLTAAAFAGVVGDAEDIPRDFKDEPATGIYKRQRQNPEQPGSGSLKNSVVTDGAVVRTSPNGNKRITRKNRRNKKGTVPAQDEKNKELAADKGSFPQIPGGREAWPLLAIAVLLLVAAGGGGYYFYQQSEE